jgi:hypothetical protein
MLDYNVPFELNLYGSCVVIMPVLASDPPGWLAAVDSEFKTSHASRICITGIKASVGIMGNGICSV